jgi:flagellar hook-associated protein 2
MAGISVAGIGSGLDLNGLVTQLIAAEAEPVTRRLDNREAQLQARISAYGTLKSSLSTFRGAIGSAALAASFQSFSTSSSDSGTVSASANNSAVPAKYAVEVNTLASAQKLASKGFAETQTVVGTGELNFRLGTYDSGGNTFTSASGAGTATVIIDSTNNTVRGIADAVNAAAIGVRASLVDDGTGQRIVFSADKTGAANSLELLVSNDGDANGIDDVGLSQLAFDPTAAGVGTGKNLTQTVAAADAAITVDGLAITRASNTFTGAIEGVTLEVQELTTGSPVSITVARDTGTASSAVSSFVVGYNALVSSFNDLASFDADTGRAGLLLGDSLLRNVESRIRRAATDVVDGLDNATFRALGDVGITTAEDGTLALDNVKLGAALEADPDAVARLFAEVGTASDSAIGFISGTAQTVPGDYAVEVTQLATRGAYVGDALTSLVIDANNKTLALGVDGLQTGTVTLTEATYTSGNELAAHIQAQVNADAALIAAGVSLSVSFESNQLVFTSSRYGSDSSVVLSSAAGGAGATLGLGTSLGTTTAGIDVAGRIGGSLATGSGQNLTGTGNASGLKLEILGGALGDRGEVTFARGVANSLTSLVDNILGANSAIEASLEGLEGRVATLGDERAAAARRLEARELVLRSRFAALDGLLAQLSQTSSFLTQQLGALSSQNNN